MRTTSDTKLINKDLASRSAKRALACIVLVAALLLSATTLAWANSTAQTLPFSQNWSSTGQITTNDNWNNVPGINGYSGDFTFTAGSNPQTQTADGAPLGLNVTANRSNPNTETFGGIAEFDRSPTTNPVVALQPMDNQDLPHLVMNLDTRNKKNVNVSYLLRDIDGSADNAAQQTVLQYRVGTSGNYTNLPAGYVADATTGPSLATKTTPVSVTLPAAAENQAVVQVRVGSANAVGTDEWVGVDDISVSSAPTVSISGASSPNEGTAQTYNYTVSDTDSGDSFTVKGGFPDCGTGGTFVSGSLSTTASGGSFQCRFPDGPASPNVRVQVNDSRNLDSNTASQAVTVQNVAPTVSLSGPTSANEGETKTYDYTVADPGQDAFTVRSGFPDCGTGGTPTGTPTKTAAGGSFQCRFPDGPASPNVRMQVADEDGANGNVVTRTVTVANVAPTVTLSGPNAADEGQTKAYTYAVADPGDDPNPAITEGCGRNGTRVDTPEPNDFGCRFPDGPASSTVSVAANDGDSASNTGSASTTVQVANVAPTATLSGPATANEGETKDYTFAVTDPGQDAFALSSGSPDCGTGGALVSGSSTTTSGGGSFNCRFPDGPASPNVRMQVADEDGADSNTASRAVAVQNVAPTVSLSGPATANEGEAKAYDFAVVDPGQDAFTVRSGSPDCGSGNQIFSGSQTTTASGGSFRCRFADGPTSPAVKTQVSDEDGGNSNVASRSVNVSNVAPTVTLDGPNAADEGQTKAYTYAVADPGDDPNPSVVEDCGQDARKADTAQENGFDCAFPDGPASPTVGVAATDEDGGRGEASRQVEVANVAPTAGDDPAEGSYETDEDTNLEVGTDRGLLSNDADRGADDLTARKTSGPARGGVEVSDDGSFVYGPDENFNGEDSFTYEACDEDGDCSAPATARISVAPVNDAPVNGVPGAQEMEEDGALAFSRADGNAITALDPEEGRMRTTVEATGGSLELRGVNGAAAESGGATSVAVEGTADEIGTALEGLRFAPDKDRNGAASLQVSTEDTGDAGSGGPLRDEDTVDIDIRPVNDAPEISEIPDATTDEDTPLEAMPFTVSDVDTPAGELTLSGSSADAGLVPDSGIEFGGSGGERTVRVTPAADRFGEVEITARVSDGEAAAPDVFVLTVRDRTPPEPPAVDLEAESDTGRSDSDGVTNDATPAFSGSAEAGSEVEVFDGGDLLGTATATGGGWRYEVPESRAFDDGEHRVTATATDAAGNTSERSGALEVVLDRRAPDTYVDAGPRSYTNAGAAAFEFSSDEEGATFECFVDDMDFESCSSPKEYAEIPEGEHAFEARAIDRAGNTDGSAAMRSWTVDERGPEVSLVEPAAGALVRGEVMISAEASDDRSLEKVEFVVDDEVVDVDRGVAADRDEPYEFGWDSTLEDDGEHSVEVRAADAAGNTTSSGARTVRVDNTAPDTFVDDSPNDPTNAASIAFGFSSADADARFECSFGGGAYEACSSPKEYPGAGERPDGDYLFGVRAVDEAGNRDDSPAERVVTLDTRAPDAPVVQRPDDGSLDNDGALVFSGTTEPGGRVKILELSGEDAEVRASSRRAGEDGSWSVGFTGVPDGEHRFAAVATDAAGNESGRSGTRTVTVDTAPPEVVDVVPNRGEAGVATNTDVEVVFSKKIQASTLEGNFALARERDGSTVLVPASVEYDAATNSATLSPEADLGYGAAHTATVTGGEGGIKDLAGSGLAADETWSFTTAEEPDTRAPDAPNILRPEEDAHDDDGTFAVSGTAEPDARVRLFDGTGGLVGSALAGPDGAWEATLTDVPEGRHVYEATATDAARNESGRSGGRAVVVDLTNPDTVIERSPESFTRETVTTFGFRSDEPGTTFECRPKDGPFEPCASPQEYTGLSDGDYLFEVRATDRAGNVDPSPARRSFVLDTRAPEARITAPSGGALVRGEVELTAEATDDRAVERVEFLVDGDRVDSDLTGPYEFGWDSVREADGEHSVEVRVTDRAGNTATSEPRAVKVDNTAPDTRITASPETLSSSRRVAFGFSSGEEGASFECSLNDGRGFEPCSFPAEYTDLADGDYLFSVRAVDEAGNRDDSPAQRRLTVDTTAPDVRIDAAPSGTTRDRSARIEFSSEPGVRSFSCSVDGAAFEDCASPLPLTGLSNGEHTFRVRATDDAGNTGPAAESSWTVDVPAPDTAAPTVAQVAPTGKRATLKSAATAAFSEKLDAATVDGSTFRLVRKGSKKPVAATVTYDPANDRAVLKPTRKLARGALYTATITTGVKDAAGNPLAADKVWRFKVK